MSPESCPYQNIKESEQKGYADPSTCKAPSSHGILYPISTQKTFIESAVCLSASGLCLRESLGPKVRTEIYPGHWGRRAKERSPDGCGRGPAFHSILHRNGFLQGVCWALANPQFSEGWKAKGGMSPAGRSSMGRREEGSWGSGLSKPEEGGVAGREGSQFRQINSWATRPLSCDIVAPLLYSLH